MIDSFDCTGAALIGQIHEDAALRDKAKGVMRPVRLRDHDAMEGLGKNGAREIVAIRLSNCAVVTVGGSKAPAGALDAYVSRLDLERMARIAR